MAKHNAPSAGRLLTVGNHATVPDPDTLDGVAAKYLAWEQAARSADDASLEMARMQRMEGQVPPDLLLMFKRLDADALHKRLELRIRAPHNVGTQSRVCNADMLNSLLQLRDILGSWQHGAGPSRPRSALLDEAIDLCVEGRLTISILIVAMEPLLNFGPTCEKARSIARVTCT